MHGRDDFGLVFMRVGGLTESFLYIRIWRDSAANKRPRHGRNALGAGHILCCSRNLFLGGGGRAKG